MAHPIIHATVSGGIAALYWFWSRKEAEKKRRSNCWNLKKNAEWQRIAVLFLIIFFGFLIDIDHLKSINLPRAYFMEYSLGGEGEYFRKTIITEPVYWLHSAYVGIVAALLSRVCRSYLPFISFVGHIALDWAAYPIVANAKKPLIRDLYVFLMWLGGG